MRLMQHMTSPIFDVGMLCRWQLPEADALPDMDSLQGLNQGFFTF